MFWIFAAVVLVLMVVHPGFRKVAFWIGGIAAALGVVAMITMALPTKSAAPVAQTGDPAIDAAFSASNVMPKVDPNADNASCEAAKKSKDSRTAFFACGGTQEDAEIPASALK